jgi:hypothetical protein
MDSCCSHDVPRVPRRRRSATAADSWSTYIGGRAPSGCEMVIGTNGGSSTAIGARGFDPVTAGRVVGRLLQHGRSCSLLRAADSARIGKRIFLVSFPLATAEGTTAYAAGKTVMGSLLPVFLPERNSYTRRVECSHADRGPRFRTSRGSRAVRAGRVPSPPAAASARSQVRRPRLCSVPGRRLSVGKSNRGYVGRKRSRRCSGQ